MESVLEDGQELSAASSSVDKAGTDLHGVTYGPEACLAAVMRSPEAVGIHDKDAWLSIFASYNIVEDPVGSTPHVSGVYDSRSRRRDNAALSRFYDTFIAANEISFHVERDIVCGLKVVRDLTIEIKMSAKVTVHVPMHLMYGLIHRVGYLGYVSAKTIPSPLSGQFHVMNTPNSGYLR